MGIVTGSAEERPMRVRVEWLQTLGKRENNFPVLAYALPPSARIDGVLGMDFLIKNNIQLDLGKGVAYVA